MNLRCNHTLLNHTLLMVSMLTVYHFKSLGQNEYLSTLNYNNLQVSRIGNAIPGITWVNTDNTAYDANHQRFFFQGNGTNSVPFYLYTINAVSGAVISNPVCPSNNPNGIVFGLQYDNKTDSLYALYADRTGATYFSWVEPDTGIVHIITTLPSFAGYYGSSFDTKDHLYICQGGGSLLAIDAASGNIVYGSGFPPGVSIANLLFDNTTGKTYAISSSSSQPYPQFDSITLSTGALHVIADLPAMSIPQIGTYTIDEAAGKYIFVGTIPGVSACIDNILYVLDISSGSVLNSTVYPYAQNTSNPLDSNVIEYSFDNKRGILYALNWYPTISTIPPLLTIAAHSNRICPDAPATFTATASPDFINYIYQWQINGTNAGANTSIYTNDNPKTGDTIRCILTAGTTCGGMITDTSNSIGLNVADTADASIHIMPSADTACAGSTITFSATSLNGGVSPFYQWQVNGVNAGTDTSIYETGYLSNGDQVACLITSNESCISNAPVLSNILSPVIIPNSSSSVSISAAKNNICSGDTVFFTATSVGGGIAPSYQWQINGNNTGTGGSVLFSNALANGDVISCMLQSSVACSPPAESADSITVIVRPTPTLTMENDTTIARGHSIDLSPSVTGDISSYEWTPSTGLDNSSVPDPIASPLASTTYQLKIVDEDGCVNSGKITITVFDPLWMPNAFTPNGDGKNDIFRVPPSIDISLFSFSIYNRWGQRVFYTTNPGEGWNGTINGQPQPTGVYIWEIGYEDQATNKRAIAKGSVILIR